MEVVTKKSNPELFEILRQNCDFDTSDIPKHGKGYVEPEAEYEGKKYQCSTVTWDYSWGIEWEYEDNAEWTEVETFDKPKDVCPHCGKEL